MMSEGRQQPPGAHCCKPACQWLESNEYVVCNYIRAYPALYINYRLEMKIKTLCKFPAVYHFCDRIKFENLFFGCHETCNA